MLTLPTRPKLAPPAIPTPNPSPAPTPSVKCGYSSGNRSCNRPAQLDGSPNCSSHTCSGCGGEKSSKVVKCRAFCDPDGYMDVAGGDRGTSSGGGDDDDGRQAKAPSGTTYNLPSGWTPSTDPSGKRYFLDANTKTTHWTLPP